ncbi:CU044_5270 family protein [Streptomyces sp. NPDC048106]|uniref:CU044_5270 family protein n=1 Tax=Streptomyces sp. NPDC048106 TaxID=3155750 RepID=UPI00345237D1
MEPSPRDLPFPGWDELVAAGAVPASDPAVLASARAAVAAAVRRDREQAAAPGAAPVPAASPASSASALPGLGEAGARADVPRRPRWRRPVLRVVVTGLSAAAAAAAVLTVAPSPADRHSGPRAAHSTGGGATASSSFLTELAADQSARPSTWDDAPYWKVAYTRAHADGTVFGRMTVYLAHRAGLTSHLRHTLPVAGDKTAPGPWRFAVGTGGLTWDQLTRLPTSPAALRARLRPYAEPEQDPSEAVFVTVGELLASPAPPKVRAALFRVAAELPGVRVAGPATDSTGRRGTAVERGDGTVVVRYLIDRSGQLLETVVFAVHALPAVPPAQRPQSLADLNGVSQGRGAGGSRPAVPAGGVVERTTYTFIGPATSPS